MNTNRRYQCADSDETAQNILVVGRNPFGLAVAEYLTEEAQSVPFVSEDQPTDVADGVKFIHRKLSDATDITLLRRELNPRDIVAGVSNPGNDPAFKNTPVDCIHMPQLLAERIRGRYK